MILEMKEPFDIYSEGSLDIPTDKEAKKFFDDRGVVQKTTEKSDSKQQSLMTQAKLLLWMSS